MKTLFFIMFVIFVAAGLWLWRKKCNRVTEESTSIKAMGGGGPGSTEPPK